MAHRKHKKYKRVDSAEVQGEGSFVLLKTPALSDMERLEVFAADGVDETAAIKFIVPLLSGLVLDWDWVDDDGNPLPKPSEDAGVFDALTFQEQMFLVTALGLQDIANLKN
jgi:hypothetical protein